VNLPEIRPLTSPVDPAFAGMTFPTYRRLLALSRTTRHPEQGDRRVIDPLAVGAFFESRPIGLALADLPVEGGSAPELLSLYVLPELRHAGLGTSLVGAVEAAVRERGYSQIATVYTAGKPAIEWVERILARRGWSEPAARTLSVRFTPQDALGAEMFEPRRMEVLARNLEIFPWSELGEEEREEMRRSNREKRWITEALEPWRFDHHGFDPSSVGARYKGRVVGWVVNHRTGPESVRFTCSFMHKGLSRRGRILPLYRESLQRVAATGCRACTFVTPLCYKGMIGLIRRWIAPFASFVGETRGARLDLTASP